MPQLKSPPPLKALVKPALRRSIEKKLEGWFNMLSSTDGYSYLRWHGIMARIFEESRLMYEDLCSHNPVITSEILPDVIRYFSRTVEDYSVREVWLPLKAEQRKITYRFQIEAMIKSLLVPSIRVYNLKMIPSNITKNLIIRALDILTNITELILPGRCADFKVSEIEDKIEYLQLLQKLEYKHDCTNEIVRILGQCCKHIRDLNFRFSRKVNDLCIEDLLKLKKLREIDLQYTNVTSKGYADLLQDLKLEKIAWVYNIDNVFDKVQKEDTEHIRKVACYTEAPNLLAEMCPLITELTIHAVLIDISDLSELSCLKIFNLQSCNYRKIGFVNLIEDLGYRLIELRFCDVDELCFTDVMLHCNALKTFEIHACIIDNSLVEVSEELSHFESLENLKLTDTPYIQKYIVLLGYYENLQCIHARSIPDFSDCILDLAVTSGRLKNLRELIIEHCSFSSPTVVLSAINESLQLCKFGNLLMMDCFGGSKGERFRRYIKAKNYDLTLISQPSNYVRTNMVRYRHKSWR